MKASKKELEADFFRVGKKEKTMIYGFFILLLLLWSIPIYSLVTNSLKVNGWSNYSYVLSHDINGVPFWRYFVNSGINAIGSSSLVVFICVLSGFAFSKINFRGRKVLFQFSVICLAISGPVLIVPFFYILKNLHLYNTHLGIIFCETTITVPFGLLMMKNYFDGLPEELMESAGIDGATIFQTFRHIYLPLAAPAIINLAVLQLMWSLQVFSIPFDVPYKGKALYDNRCGKFFSGNLRYDATESWTI